MNQIAVNLKVTENKFTYLSVGTKWLEINRIIGNCQSESSIRISSISRLGRNVILIQEITKPFPFWLDQLSIG